MALSTRQRAWIREDYHTYGFTVRQIAGIRGVSIGTVRNVLRDKHGKMARRKADMMEAMLGGSTVDDGCYDASVPKNTLVPDNQIDKNDPLSILIAEEEVRKRDKTDS